MNSDVACSIYLWASFRNLCPAALRDVFYAANGDVMEIEKAMKASELPATVMAMLTKNYPNAKILAAEKLTRGAVLQYESTINSAGKKVDLVFTDEGKLLVPAANWWQKIKSPMLAGIFSHLGSKTHASARVYIFILNLTRQL